MFRYIVADKVCWLLTSDAAWQGQDIPDCAEMWICWDGGPGTVSWGWPQHQRFGPWQLNSTIILKRAPRGQIALKWLQTLWRCCLCLPRHIFLILPPIPYDLTSVLSLSLNNVQPSSRHAISNCYWLGKSKKSCSYDTAPALNSLPKSNQSLQPIPAWILSLILNITLTLEAGSSQRSFANSPKSSLAGPRKCSCTSRVAGKLRVNEHFLVLSNLGKNLMPSEILGWWFGFHLKLVGDYFNLLSLNSAICHITVWDCFWVSGCERVIQAWLVKGKRMAKYLIKFGIQPGWG